MKTIMSVVISIFLIVGIVIIGVLGSKLSKNQTEKEALQTELKLIKEDRENLLCQCPKLAILRKQKEDEITKKLKKVLCIK